VGTVWGWEPGAGESMKEVKGEYDQSILCIFMKTE
jgi:hypothetical protein